MKIAYFVLGVFLSVDLSADPITDPMTDPFVDPVKSRFQVLQDAYQSASDVPEVSDFVPPVKTEILCVGALPSNPDVLSPYHVRVVETTISAGEPGNGPLFPPIQAVTEKTVIFGSQKTVSRQSAAGFGNRVGDRDFEIRVSAGTYDDVPEAVGVFFRRKRELLPFKAVKEADGGSQAFLYGYCYFQSLP